MPHFLSQVAEQLIKETPNLKGQAIILPSRRAAVFLKKELSQKITNPVWSPYIDTIENFLLETLQWEKADQPSLIFELYHCYCNITEEPRESFAEFSQWANLLLADFNELDRYKADAKSLFNYLADVERIKNWDLKPDGELSELVKNYLKLWTDLPALYQEYTQHLKSSKKVYQGLAYRQMAEKINNFIPDLKKRFNKISFVGFNALNSAEEEIMLSLYEEKVADFYWDVDAYYFEDKNQEAGNFLRNSKLVKRLIEKDEFNWVNNELGTGIKNIKTIEVSGKQLQAVAANSSVVQMQEDGLENIAVVMADEELLPLFLNNLADSVSTLNVTMGLALKQTPAAGFFQLLIDMAVEQELQLQKSPNAVVKLHHSRWDELLGSPLYKIWTKDVETAEALRLHIRKQNRIYVSVADLTNWSEGQFSDKVINFFNEIIESPCQKIWKQLAIIAHSINNQHQQKDSLLQSLFSFYQLFNRLDILMAKYPVVEDLKTASFFYKDLVSSVSLDLYGEPLSGLQVMGMLETRTLDFKNLIISSLNEGVLPKGRSENSLIPFDIKKEFGLPTYLDKDAIFAYHFYRLIQRAENIHLIYDGQPGNFGSGEPSRFIRQLQYELPKANKGVSITSQKPHLGVSLNETAEEEIEKTPTIMERLEAMAEKGFSATALIDYINDPLEFYTKRVLNLREEEDVEEQAGYNTQGTIVHEILEHYYSKKTDDGLVAKSVLKTTDPSFGYSRDELRNEVERLMLVHAKIDEPDKGKNLLITESLVGMLIGFLKQEKENLIELEKTNQVLSLVGLEKKLIQPLSLKSGKTVNVLGVIDRIDRIGATTRLIDYKTGGVNPSDLPLRNYEDLKQPKKKNKSLQLLLYAWLYFMENDSEEELEAAIISLRSPKKWLMKLKINGATKLTREIIPAFEEILTSIIEEIMDKDVPFSKKLLTLESDE